MKRRSGKIVSIDARRAERDFEKLVERTRKENAAKRERYRNFRAYFALAAILVALLVLVFT